MLTEYIDLDELEETRQEEAIINAFREGRNYWDRIAQTTSSRFAHNRALWYADTVIDLLDIPF